jgi:hypothetical protein
MPKKGSKCSEETKALMRAARARHKPHIVGRYGLTLQKVESELAAGRLWCSDCKQFHDRDAFGNGKRLTRCKAACSKRNRDHYALHAERRNTDRKAYYRANVEAEKFKAKDRSLEKYGASREWYRAKLAEQGGGCAICGVDKPDDRHVFFNVDHNHKCCPSKTACEKCRRGLLCFRCNTAIERLEAVPDWNYQAYSYLAKYGSPLVSI